MYARYAIYYTYVGHGHEFLLFSLLAAPAEAVRSQRPTRSVSLTNGEQLDKDKSMSSKVKIIDSLPPLTVGTSNNFFSKSVGRQITETFESRSR